MQQKVQEKLNYYKSNNFKVLERWTHEPYDSPEMEQYIVKRTDEWREIKSKTAGGLKSSLFGGRVNFTSLKYDCQEGEKIRYVDFLSLYPTVLYSSKFPIGHPQIITENIQELSLDTFPYFGFICCSIIPPEALNIPVLPTRVNDKLYFTLCSACAENGDEKKGQFDCHHSNKQRAVQGTWTTAELYLALEKGYKFLKIYCVYHFDQYDSSLFKEYIRIWLQIKQQASGWPESTRGSNDEETEQLKAAYIMKWKHDFDIDLQPELIEKNSAKRSLAKLKLNSLWVCLFR